jgi:glycosyltransferase involved in cell wall biosynthesis
MRVIYSIGAKFAGSGIGTIAYHAVRGLYHHGLLHCLFCSSYRPSEIPRQKIRAMGLLSQSLRKLATFDTSRWLGYLQNLLFDAWATRYLEPADLFHVWANFGLRSLRRMKEMGAVTIVECASSHPVRQARLLAEEHARWGLRFRYSPMGLRRTMTEIQTADHVLIPSDFVRCSFLGEGFPDARLLQVPFGVDTARFQAGPRQNPHPFRVLFVGRIGLRKGVPYLLEAWQRLGWRDAELWLVGRAETAFEPVLARWDGLPKVKRVGYVLEPASLYQQADVFAFPTIEEGSALVTYEALASGLPVVTTPNAGSVVQDGIEGFLVPIRDVDALAGRLEQLRADGRLRQAMGQAAKKRAEAFTWQRYGDTLARMYEKPGFLEKPGF